MLFCLIRPDLLDLNRSLLLDTLHPDVLNVLFKLGGRKRASLPGRNVRVEELIHLLESTTLGLWEHQEDVDGHANTEGSKDEVGAVLDILKSWGNSVGQDEVESPVGSSGERDGLGTDTKRVNLSRVGPRNGSPRDGEGADEEVRASNDSLGSSVVVSDGPGGGGIAVRGIRRSIATHQTTNEEEPKSHEDGSNQENRAATPTIDEQDSRDGHDNVEDVLDGGSLQVGVLACDTGTLEDEDDVVHGNVHSCELRPGLESHTEEDTLGIRVTEQFTVRAGSKSAIKVDGILNLPELGDDFRVVLITVGAQVGQNLKCLIQATLVGQPARGEGEDRSTSKEDNTGDNLDTPRDTESGVRFNEGATILDKVLDQDTPSNSPLLKRDNTTTNVLGGDLRLVNRNNHGRQTDCHSVDDTTNNQHGSVDGGALDDRSHNPDQRSQHDRALA